MAIIYGALTTCSVLMANYYYLYLMAKTKQKKRERETIQYCVLNFPPEIKSKVNLVKFNLLFTNLSILIFSLAICLICQCFKN